jgi:sulfhydrogenase subunit gamma (sulfur reductase)
MPPTRCAVWYALENRANYGEITIVYGARTVADLVYVDEPDKWAEFDHVRVIHCVDPDRETPDWKGEIGFVPHVFETSNGRR